MSHLPNDHLLVPFLGIQFSSGSFEQLDDVLAGAVGFVEGSFEFAVWPGCWSGLMVKEAVGERAAELFMEEDEEQRDLGSFLSRAIGVAFSVAGEQPMSF